MDTSKGVAIGTAVSAANGEPNHSSIADTNDEEWLILSKRDSKSRLLPRRMIFVGRQDCDICVPSTTVDMRHAVLFYSGQHFHIKDLNSAYGTYVNEKRIPEQCYHKLNHSDRLRFGFGSDMLTIEKISSLPMTSVNDSQLNSINIESVNDLPQMEPQRSDGIICDKRVDNLSKEGLTTPVSRLSCENHSNSSLSNSVDSLDEIKSKHLNSVRKEELYEINDRINEEVVNSLPPSTPAPDSLESVDLSVASPTAFIISFDDDNENNKKLNIRDSIRKFAPPKPDSIEKQRPKSARNESIKCNENPFPKQKSPTFRSKRQTNALSANKTTKIINKITNTPTCAVANTSPENGGHLSDSAAYLINRMLSNQTTDHSIHNQNMRSNTMSPEPIKETYTDKGDSGLSDDIKSDSGKTFIVDDDENEEEVEVERKKLEIEVAYGNDDSATVSLNSSPRSSLTLNSPTLLMNIEEKFAKKRQSYGSPQLERKVAASDSEVKPQTVSSNSTFTRTKRKQPTLEEMLHNFSNKINEDKMKNSSHIYSNDFNRNQCNSSHTNQFPAKNESKNNSNNQFKGGVSQSAPSTPRSPLVSRKLAELRTNSRQKQNPLNGIRRKNSWNSDMDCYESYNSDESTDQSHRSSTSALSKDGGNVSTASVPSKINYNRAFALRRARLGIETPGIDVTIKKTGPGLNRSDGGRFSLRVPKKDLNDSSKKLGNRNSSKEKLNNNCVQRKGSDPLGSMKSGSNRCQPVMSSVSDNERRNSLNSNRFNQLNNRLRHNYNLNNITNSSKNDINRQKTFTDSEICVPQRSKQMAANLNNFNSNNRRLDSNVKKDCNMSASLTEPSHKPPISNFQMKNVSKSGLELTALDGLVVSAINQLSQKLRNNLTEVMESQRSKHPTSSQARAMIDEVLPQLSAPDRRLNDNTVSVSRDLSAILKNLKKVEQSLEVVNHLLEPNTTAKTHNCRKQSNDFFVVDV